MAKIFVSYRRTDTRSEAGRLFDKLEQAFGSGNVFKDVDSIAGGANVQQIIARSIAESTTVLALIGPQWLEVRNGSGQRRLDVQDDWVRQEIEAALSRGIHLMPVLVNEASFPLREQLPESLQNLANLNALPLRPDPDFRHDCERIIRHIQQNGGSGGNGTLETSTPGRARIQTEVEHRISLLPLLLKDEFTYDQLHTVKECVTGQPLIKPGIGKIGDFYPLFSEFESRSLFELIWQLLESSAADDTDRLQRLFDHARQLPAYFDRLIMVAPRGVESSRWTMPAEDRDAWQHIVEAMTPA